jgi:FtsP/CotA-like multicopper oxidase with cupredoxin domain
MVAKSMENRRFTNCFGVTLIAGLILLVAGLCGATPLQAQDTLLLIGRTTGTFALGPGKQLRVFGFANSLAEEVSLPAPTIEMMVGDSAVVDFWNISQDGSHGWAVTKSEAGILPASPQLAKGIGHMQHGYYQLAPKQAGTYLYYDPLNYPFNVQAGMFGMLVVQPKEDLGRVWDQQEIRWCGFEIDPAWHTDKAMDVDISRYSRPQPIPAVYAPQHFLLNGKCKGKLRDLDIRLTIGAPVRFRWANAGRWEQRIEFPEGVLVTCSDALATLSRTESGTQSARLQPLEACTLVIQGKEVGASQIRYHFIDPNAKGAPQSHSLRLRVSVVPSNPKRDQK